MHAHMKFVHDQFVLCMNPWHEIFFDDTLDKSKEWRKELENDDILSLQSLMQDNMIHSLDS
jgi:hypothetical protein